MKNLFAKKNEKGQGLVEYALILVLVSIVVIAALTILGPTIGNIFSSVNNSLVSTGGGGGVVAAPAAATQPPAAPAPTMTYEQWCASLGGHHINPHGLCVQGANG
jgi:pilus assembly protein Flp/PilA